MPQISVSVQAKHTIQDDEGRQLSPGFDYKVKRGPVVDAHIASGELEVNEEPEANATKTSRPRSTGTDELQES